MSHRRDRTPRGRAIALAVLVLGSLLSACGSHHAGEGRIEVVAGELQWGNIAAQLGGGEVHVTSLITDPNADPHEYTADAADALAIHGAQLVVVNGAGYDPFMGQLLSASGNTHVVLTVATIAHATGTDPNPHFWYDLATVREVAASIEASYEVIDPRDHELFTAKLQRFDASLVPIGAIVRQLHDRYRGAPVAYTERVPGYLLAAAGLRVVSPPGFARAVEAGNDPSLADTVALENLLSSHGVKALLYNVQTVTPVTTTVRADARAAGVPVVAVSETLPAWADSYQAWQMSQDTALLSALQR